MDMRAYRSTTSYLSGFLNQSSNTILRITFSVLYIFHDKFLLSFSSFAILRQPFEDLLTCAWCGKMKAAALGADMVDCESNQSINAGLQHHEIVL